MVRRRDERGVTAVEAAVAFAVFGGAICAVAPACIRSIRVAYTAEAVENLGVLVGAGAQHMSDAQQAPLSSTPLTPASVPRGVAAAPAPEAWEHPTWRALGFALEAPHRYSYRVEVDVDPATPLRVVAQGDLDGDGVLSTFVRTAGREGDRVVPRPEVIGTSDLE